MHNRNLSNLANSQLTNAGTPEPGGLGGCSSPTVLLMYDVKIEAFDPVRKYTSLFLVKVHSPKVPEPESSGPIEGK